MLTVNPDELITIDECLEHPWTTGHDKGLATESILSTDGYLAGTMKDLDLSKRRVARERTLLSSLHEVHVSKVILRDEDTDKAKAPITIYAKNKAYAAGNPVAPSPVSETDISPTHGSDGDYDVDESGPGAPAPRRDGPDAGLSGVQFMAVGNGKDEALFSEEGSSRFVGGK